MKQNDREVNSKVGTRFLIAGDVGATKTLLGLFEADGVRPRRLSVHTFATASYTDLTTLLHTFRQEAALEPRQVGYACFGMAGPIMGRTAQLTNVAWRADADEVELTFGMARVALLNDLEAMALGVPVLLPDELLTLQAGQPMADGNMALIAAGTGLGEAFLHRVGGRLAPAASEGGHADFAARTEREIDVLRALTARYGRVEVERVVSGPGLANLHRITHRGDCHAVEDVDGPEAPSSISASALARSCLGCMEALDLFVSAYGAEAGNLALRSVATGGLFVGGGIAPKLLTALASGRFMQAFLDKAPMQALLTRVPVHVILNPEAGLIGAAVGAAQLLDEQR